MPIQSYLRRIRGASFQNRIAPEPAVQRCLPVPGQPSGVPSGLKEDR